MTEGPGKMSRYQGSPVLVSIHTRNENEVGQHKGERHFTRVPSVGERFSMDLCTDVFVVEEVTHVPFGEGDSDAEVYARKVI